MKIYLRKMVICATVLLSLPTWADVENKATATWLFNQYGTGETVASTTAGSYQVIDHDGLYSVIGDGSKARTITTETSRLASDLKDGETTIFPRGWYTGLYFDAGRGTGIDKAANYSGGGGRMSLRINRPGKLYILCRNYNEARLIGVFKGNTNTATVTSAGNTSFQMLTVEITKSELQSASSYDKNVICHITGYYIDAESKQQGNGFKIYGVKYVVSEDAAELSKSVTIPSCGYATFSGPHTYTIAAVSGDGTASAYYASEESDNKIILAQTGNKRIAPSQGFIIKGTPGKTATLKSVEEQTTITGTNLLVANIAAYNLQPTTSITQSSATTYYNYILVPKGESNAVFSHTTGTGNLGANKAFLRSTTNVVAGARSIELFFEDETTAINNVEHKSDNSNHFFNLSGQEVSRPTKGLYIKNGKKVIIK